MLYLDTIAGGLKPYQAGGGRQSKTLRLRDSNGKEYVIRSIDKSFGKALPEIYQNTFIENILNDQVTIAHPYSAITIAPMAEAAKILHTWPKIGFVPRQPALDSFNTEFGNQLYLLEQRPDENWEEAANFANSKKIIGTEKLLENIREDNDNSVDQQLYVRSRLFDMIIGDWGRHEDQWRWALIEDGKKNIYKPIPRDRDQAYTKFDGVLLGFLLTMADLRHLQSFKGTIRNAKSFNFPARNLDSRLLNEISLDDWKKAVLELQASLTDEVIENAIRQLPPEVFEISGKEMIRKIKSRRDRMLKYGVRYYRDLAEEVEVVGTDKREFFEIERRNAETEVRIYKITKEGEIKKEPIYSRVFKDSETDEIRLYGLDDDDLFKVNGESASTIKLRIIGGEGSDSISDASTGRKHIDIYDDKDNHFEGSARNKLHLSNDTTAVAYDYAAHPIDKRGFVPSLFYSNSDRFYVSLGYRVQKHQWPKKPFGYEHGLYFHYSLTQKAYAVWYEGIMPQFIGKWDLKLAAHYDDVKWINFFGAGNKSTIASDDADFYRLRTHEWFGGAGLTRVIGKYSSLTMGGFYQKVSIINDPERFVAKTMNTQPASLKPKSFAGAQLDYGFQKVDDAVVPTRGINFLGSLNFTKNVNEADRSFGNLSGTLVFYIPLSKKISFVSRTGAATMKGQAEFYQLNSIGGSQSLRGYRRDRFYGKSALYNNAELQWITNIRSHLFNGKGGLLLFYDNGRVWLPNEESNTWHSGYGAGVLLAPFNKISFSLSYAFSQDASRMHIRFNKMLF